MTYWINVKKKDIQLHARDFIRQVRNILSHDEIDSEAPFIVSLETPESHLEKINKKKKKIYEEKEIEQKIEKSPKLKSEQVNLLKRVESLLNNEKNKHKKDYILLNESYINFTNLFSLCVIS